MNIDLLVKSIEKEFIKYSNPLIAKKQEKYMRNKFKFQFLSPSNLLPMFHQTPRKALAVRVQRYFAAGFIPTLPKSSLSESQQVITVIVCFVYPSA